MVTRYSGHGRPSDDTGRGPADGVIVGSRPPRATSATYLHGGADPGNVVSVPQTYNQHRGAGGHTAAMPEKLRSSSSESRRGDPGLQAGEETPRHLPGNVSAVR